jgi:hypothetical protein
MANVPNLDATSQQELMSFWMKYQNVGKRKDCEALVGDRRKGYTIIAGNLGAYAANKSAAMGCRERGDVSAALSYERICDSIYDTLPADCRW